MTCHLSLLPSISVFFKMNQRQSIVFVKPENKDATLSTASYMIENSDVPLTFLDKEDFTRSFNGPVTLEKIETKTNVDFMEAMSDFVLTTENTPMVAVVEPSLCIVGKSSQYYVFDLYNEILYTTTSPEWEFPNKKVDVTFYQLPKLPTAKVTESIPPAAKKQKKRETNRTVTDSSISSTK